jgi:ubiquinone/menaquinone biosynthesis C-methylase UbiE
MPKDLFSDRSDLYAKYRPTYPEALYHYILSFVEKRNHAWDCATGNGQAAGVLANYFEKVEASDISAAQLEKAVQKPNIQYHMAPAEHTPFPDDTFDLITVAQAYHWLSPKEFYKEATRTGKPNAVVAAWVYNLFQCEDQAVNQIVRHFYRDITLPYWDAARKYVEEGYKTVDFAFDPLPSREFSIQLRYTKEQFKGYLSSWSGVQAYIKKKGSSPLLLIENDLDRIWNDTEQKEFHFPLALRIGRIRK